MTFVCRSYVIDHKFIYLTIECGVQYPPDINPICGQMDKPCPGGGGGGGLSKNLVKPWA